MNIIETIEKIIEIEEELKKISNFEISQLLIEHVWGKLDIPSAQAALIEEAINRLSKIN